MDQTTTFSPHLCVRLLDGRTVAFARSKVRHWKPLIAAYAAPLIERSLAEIDAIPAGELRPLERAAARAKAWNLEVPIGEMAWRCANVPEWTEAHLIAAFVEAGGSEADARSALDLIPWQVQQEIANEIAMLPVVKNLPVGTAENPLIAGVEFASTGATPSSSSSGTAPASTPTT